MPGLPEPRPLYEIFVYSPRFEGIHLRGGKVARGGLRWSDRPDDFRTEVLGLVKAQMVKNTVIVPVGSKGGFVLKKAPPASDRDAFMKEGIACYQDYLRGLLDVTDNLVGGKTGAAAAGACASTATIPTSWSPPTRARPPSPTTPTPSARNTATGWATPSPPAAAWATTTRRWASRRAAPGRASSATSASWASTRRRSDFTVVGIGDMSGDVFGNGMLLSRHIRLVAAFDHRHIFIDPDPDSRGLVRRARAPVQAAALVLGRLRHEADLRRRRRLGALGEVDPDLAAGARGARHRGRAAHADRTGHARS